MRRYVILAFILFIVSKRVTGLPAFFRSDEPPDPEEFARSYGYFAESHTVTTPDGYILTLHRVASSAVHLNSSKEPFILQHGLVANSAQWIALEPKQSLPFILADNGFDIWMPNIRGNMYSRKHKHLKPSDAEFWDYSWHEHGVIDMPTIIDYILTTTKHKQLWYAGHSMGTTMFFVMASMRPEYNQKIKHMFALAPVAYMSHIRTPMKSLAPYSSTLVSLGKTTLNGHLKTDFILIQLAKNGVCPTMKEQCARAVNDQYGPNPRSNITTVLQALKYMPDYASLKQIAHYGQLMNADFTFRLYDYNDQNNVRYKSAEPPRYPVEKISVPLTFLYSKNDYFSEPIDVETFSKHFRNIKMHEVTDPKFNHMDFILSTYAHELVYQPMLKVIQEVRMKRH